MNHPYLPSASGVTIKSGPQTNSIGTRSILYVCLRVVTKGMEGMEVYYEWFSIDPTGYISSRCIEEFKETDYRFAAKKRNFQFKHPGFRIPSYIPESATFVAVGSRIYALGGIKSGIDPRDQKVVGEVYVYDTSTATDTADWKPLSPMNTPRSRPEVVALGGKLYVMGSHLTNDIRSKMGPWSEVYDIRKNCWSVLDDYAPWDRFGRQDYVCVDCVLVVPKDKDRDDTIMVAYFYQTGYTYFYYPRLNQWNRVWLPIEFQNTCKDGVVAVEQVLFIAAEMYFCAYDLANDPGTLDNIETARPEARMIKGLEKEYPLEEEYPLISGGGKKLVHLGSMDFCIVWPSVDQDCSGFKTTTIHCLKFHVDKDVWLASVLSHDRFRVQAPLCDEVASVYLEQCVQVMEWCGSLGNLTGCESLVNVNLIGCESLSNLKGCEFLGDFIGTRQHPSRQWEQAIYDYNGETMFVRMP